MPEVTVIMTKDDEAELDNILHHKENNFVRAELDKFIHKMMDASFIEGRIVN